MTLTVAFTAGVGAGAAMLKQLFIGLRREGYLVPGSDGDDQIVHSRGGDGSGSRGGSGADGGGFGSGMGADAGGGRAARASAATKKGPRRRKVDRKPPGAKAARATPTQRPGK
jgi:hypothetical protein